MEQQSLGFGGTSGLCSTMSQCEYSIPFSDIQSANSLTAVYCVSELNNDSNTFTSVWSGGQVGLPLDAISGIPGSSWSGWWYTFPAVTNVDGVWDSTLSLWSPECRPDLNGYGNGSDTTVVIKNQVTTSSSYSSGVIRNLFVAENSSLQIQSDSLLTVGYPPATGPWISAEVLIKGDLIVNGTLVIHTPTHFQNGKSTAEFDKLKVIGNDTVKFENSTLVAGTLEIEGSFIEANQIHYKEPKTLIYSSTYTRGWEWPMDVNTGYSLTPSDVVVNHAANVTSFLEGDLWIDTLKVSGKLFLESDVPNRTLHVGLMYIPDGFVQINHTVILENVDDSQIGTVQCGQGGQYLFTNGTTVFGFPVKVLDQHNQQVGYYGKQTAMADVGVSGPFSIQIDIELVAHSEWFLDGVLCGNNMSLLSFDNKKATIVINLKELENDCWGTKTLFIYPRADETDIGNTIGIFVGVVLGAGLVIGGIVLFVRRRKKRQHNKSDSDELHMELDVKELSQSTISVEPLRSDWQIDYTSIVIGKELGRGAFGVVYKCRWRNTDCVVKQLDFNTKDEHAIKLFLKEAKNVQNLRPHPNVCLVLGVCVSPEHPICIVMEYLSQGSLDNLLYNRVISVDAKRLIAFGKDVASGMSHLHAENILHCDLACRNILVDMKGGEYTLKIADFGLSRQTEQSEYQASDKTFPIKWTAPETLRQGVVSKGSDVWSFAVVMWEMMQADQPYPDMSNSEVVSAVCDQGYRLPQPTHMPNPVYNLMLRCWDNTPSKRPSFDEIFQILSQIQQGESTKSNDSVYGNAN